MKKKVLHIITTTGVGGSENMLYKYLLYSNKEKIEHSVISLKGIDVLGVKIKELDIPMYGLSSPVYTFKGMKELYKVASEFDPHVLQSWLYHSDLVSLVLRVFLKVKLCWNIRSYKVYKFKTSTGILVRFLALFSKIPDVIFINSLASKDYHHKIMFRPKRWQYIPNGFDLSIFKPETEIDLGIKEELNIDKSFSLIGMVSRFSKDKDHVTFLRSCALVRKKMANVHFVMVGKNIDSSNVELTNLIYELEISDTVHLLGTRDDIPTIMPCFDILCSSSLDEAFPNVIGEAMSCEVPCVVTDIGDCALLVGDTGRIVQPGSPESMSIACLDLLSLSTSEFKNLGNMARGRIMKNFSIKKVSNEYDKVYLGL